MKLRYLKLSRASDSKLSLWLDRTERRLDWLCLSSSVRILTQRSNVFRI